jgi:hypothetical protein
LELTERDYLILGLVFRFKFCLGRHLSALGGFSGQRATDRRLRALIESGYMTRRKYLYGIPFLYTLTHKGRVLLGVNKREDKIRVEKITHDIYVLDTVIFYVRKHGVSLRDIESEKELHIKDGFGARKHQPDFVFSTHGKKNAVEIELSPKTKERLEKNIRDNYLNYDGQTWITNDSKVFSLLQEFTNNYSSIEVVRLEEITEFVKR